MLGIKDWTMAIAGFPDPFITCCFVGDFTIFVALIDNETCTHYHFLWDIKLRSIIGDPQKVQFDQNEKKNFPYKSFYDEQADEIYVFYRQGYSFIIDAKDVSKFSCERMTDSDLG